MPTLELFFQRMAERKFKVFESTAKPTNINIVGWRSTRARVNRFEDFISVYYQGYNRSWVDKRYEATTYPGLPWLINPINKKGTAILVPGQYPGAYELGEYKGYTALKQVRPVKVYRDKNQDSAWDLSPDSIEEGLFGIHIHKAGFWSKLVGFNSAGCQVFKEEAAYNDFIALCKRAAKFWGNSFTYTLLEF